MGDDWFERLFGLPERGGPEALRRAVDVQRDAAGGLWLQTAAGRFRVGAFSLPTLAELRARGAAALSAAAGAGGTGGVALTHAATRSVLSEHASHPGATFQAASQFNCLEFSAPSVTPEDGIAGYEHDHTQGPDCALACAAGTLYRNYLLPMPSGAVGQSAGEQLDTLDSLGRALGNDAAGYWRVRNGYSTLGAGGPDALRRLGALLDGACDDDAEALRGCVRVGLQQDVGVTWASRWARPREEVRVHQVYCSALSLGAYAGGVPPSLWRPVGTLVLDAAYEATLWAAVLAGSPRVFLTLLGGGVFGNPPEWIAAAIGRAVARLEAAGARLDVTLLHFRSVDEGARALVDAAVCSARSAPRTAHAAAAAAPQRVGADVHSRRGTCCYGCSQ